MAVLTLGEYKKKKKQEEEQQQKVSNKKSSVMTLDEYKKQPGARLGRTDGSDIQYLPEESQKVIRLTEAKKKFDEKTNELDIATKRLDDIRTQNLKRAGVKTVQELLEEEKSERLPSYSFVKQGGSLSPYNSLNKKISENNAKYGQVNNNPEVLKEREKVNKIANDLIYSKYKYNVADVDNHKMSTMEKIFGTIPRAISDLGSAFSTDNIYIDENGKKIHLPTRDALLQQKASEDSSLPIKMLTDTIYNGTKILATEGLNLVSGGMGGTALYFNDMFNDSYKNAYNKTGDTGKAFANGLAQTGLEFITEKLLGGVSKQLTGGKASALENAISDKLYTKLGSKNLAKIAGSMGSEATEEFVQEFAGNAIDLLTLGSESGYKDIKDAVLNEEVLKAALYSGLVGGLSGGMITGMNIGTGLDKSAQKIQLVEDFKTQLEESKKNTTNEATIKALDTAIDNANKYLARPFTNLDNEEANLVLNRNIDNYTNNILPTQQNTNVNTLENLQQFNQKQQSINDQQVQEEANKRIANIENEMNNLAPTASTEGMNLQESAARYNIDPQKQIATQTMMENRGVEARWDGTRAEFKDGTVNAIWQKDENGNRSVIFNPNASENTIIENIAVHELTHDIMSSTESKNALKANEIMDYVQTLEGYAEARQSLVETYSKQYNPESKNFKSLIDEEVVADVLGRKLGNQEFINRLNNQKPKLARNIYNWVVEKLNSIVNRGGKVRNERIYWENVKNRFETAFNMEYNNSTNEADTRLATVENNPYGHTKEFVEMTKKEQEEIHEVVSPLAAKFAGIEESYSVRDINGNKIIFDIFSDGNYRITEIEKTKNIIEEVVDERNPNKDSRYSMASSEQRQRYSGNGNESNRNNGTSKQDARVPTKEQIESQDRVSNKTQERNNRELDNSSFSYRGSHQIENAKSITELDLDDIKNKVIDIDGYLTKQSESDFNKLKKILKSPNEQVKIYRAAPVNELNNGDWVTTDKSYAQNVANNNGGKVYTYEVNANELYYPDNIRELPSLHRLSSFQYNAQSNVTDNQGRELSKQQQEYFKDSKVRDENGNLLTLYHGSNSEFTVFDINKAGESNKNARVGFWFTPSKTGAENFARDVWYGNKKPTTYEAYLNIKNPKIYETFDNTEQTEKLREEYKKSQSKEKALYEKHEYDSIGMSNVMAFLNYKSEENTIKTLVNDFGYTEEQAKQYINEAKEVQEIRKETRKLEKEVSNSRYTDSYEQFRTDIYKMAGKDAEDANFGGIGMMLDNERQIVQDYVDSLKKQGFDGIIIKNTRYDAENMGGNNDQYVAFNSNQIKNVDNLNPTSNEDIRYSKEAKKWDEFVDKNVKPTGTTGTLMAIHNLNEDKLKGILELGGFPVPSIAITDPNKVNHSQFGNISVLFNKDTIDPSNYKNEVYDRDVWSPTFPQIDYELNDDGIEKVANDLGIEEWRLRDAAEDNSKPEYLIERLLREEKLIDKYIEDNNLKYETAYKDAETRIDFHQRSKKIRKFIIDNDFDFRKLYKDKKLQQEYFDLIKDYYDNSTLPEAVKENIYNEKITQLKDFIDFQEGAGDLEPVRQLKRYQDDFDLIKSGENKVVDEWQTNKNKKDTAIKNGIEDYLKEQVKDIYGEKGIRNDRDYLDSKGNRRSFWQLHDEYNLENIVDALTQGDTTGTQNWFAGYGQIQANMANRFNSISDIKANENRLTSLAENNTILEEARNNIENDIDEIVAKNDTDMYVVSELLADFARGDLTVDNFKELTRNYYQTTQNVPDKLINKIIDDMNALKNLPTDYFEAKPQRAVGLDEVEAVVIPNTVSQEFRDALNDAGLDFVEYDPKVEGDRNRVINKFDNLKFSKNSNGKWQDFVNRHFKPSGTNTNIGSIKLPTKKQPTIPTKQTPKETTKQNILPINKELANKKVEQKVNKQGLEAIRKATNAGKSYLQLKRSEVRELRNELKEYLGLSKEQLTNAKTYNGIKNKVEQFMNKQVEYLDEDLKRVKKEVRNIKIKVDPSVREQITDYGEFRKQNFGKLRLTSDGINVDSVYSELSELYPYYFDSSITSEADMLYELSDFMDKPNTIIEEYKLSDSDMQKATDKIFNSLINNSLSNEDIESMQNDILEKYSRRTRKVVQEEVLNDMGVTVDDISKGKDISAAEFQRTDPVRVNEKVFGAEVGQKMNDATVNRTKHNEAEGIRFLNKERDDIRELGIKPRSKESAAVQKYGEKQYLNKENELVKYGDIELANEFPNVKIQEKIKHAAEVIRNKYDKYIEQINNVITRLGYDPIPKRPDYMRHFQEINDKLSQWGIPLNPTDLNKENIPTDINGLTDQFRPGKNWFASALQRKGFKTTYDAITGIDGYLESAKNLIYHTEDIQRYRALSKFIRDTYGQTHGMDNVDIDTEEGQQRLNDIFDNKLSKYVAWLDEQANSLAGKKGGIDRAAERILGRKVYTIMDAAKKQVGSNMTGFNVRSALTNFASAVQGASKTNKLAFIKGTLSTLGNIVHNDGLINKSDFLTSRFGSDQLSKKLWQKASNAGQIFMTGSDYFTSNQIWRSKYYENLSKGMTESQAIKKADDFAARIMGDRSKGATAEIFNSKTLGLLTQFQLEVNNQWSSIIHDNKMDLKTGNKSGATVVFQLGQLAAMSYFFNNFMKSLTGSDVMIDPIDMFKKLLGSDDDDDDKEKTLEQRATEVFGDLINDLPFASFLTGGRIPMAEAFTGVETAFKKLTNQKDKFGNDIKWDDVKKDAISSGFYWLLPTGYGQIRKTSKGLSMYDKKLPVPGSYTESGNLRFDADTSTGGKVKAALFGQYSSKQAQDYIDSGYKTIRKQNLPEMKDLGMSASEYRKYREQLNSSGKKSIQKINYVDDSSYTDKQKNIMYKNILKLKDNELKFVNNMSIKDQNKYLTARTQANAINSNKDIESNEKHQQISDLIINTNFSDKDMAYLYSKYYSSEDKLNTILSMNIPIKEYIKADTKEVKGSYYAKTGKMVKDSKKKEYAKYVNTLNLSAAQKAILIKMKYNSFKTYDNKIVNYINKIDTSANEKKVMLKSIGFKNFDKDVINYINSQHISRAEKEKKLKNLGFTIRNGRVYYK